VAGYQVVYHEIVVAADLPGLPRNIQRRMLTAIERRLAVEPARYGARLRKSLLGLWKIRVGDYRVIYQIDGRTVQIWAIGHRRDAYPESERRWNE
jgi:mRNA interferase RelE/StbE